MTHGAIDPSQAARDPDSRARLFYFNGGFFTQGRVRRILDLAGFDLTLGKPGPHDRVAVWGNSPTSGRGAAMGQVTGAPLVYVEDAFLRSIKPGRSGEPPLGLTIDHQRPYFDSSAPSDLEDLLAKAPLDDAALLGRARANMARLAQRRLSKYNDFDTALPPPAPGYVLVIDQSRDDASITLGAGSVAHFREMLVYAQQDHPGAHIVIKAHPDSVAGHRPGHFGPEHLSDRMTLLTDPIPPHTLFEGAVAVYTVSSGMGFEAIMAGHRPVVFGQPFYAGWGLTKDHQPLDRRQRRLTRAQLFAGAMMLYPTWYDPYTDTLCELERVIDALEALTRAHQEDRHGYRAHGVSLWKRPHFQAFFGRSSSVTFGKTEDEASQDTTIALHWASKWKGDDPGPNTRLVEDGFLRSRGLGADLVPPLSLVTDGQGIYYDPSRPSDLETLISNSVTLPLTAEDRATRLIRAITASGLTKYNLTGVTPGFDAQGREVILVPGQVEDDASILKGAADIHTNAELVDAVRRDFPEAFIIYKPHPDVERGLRKGGEPPNADLVARKADPLALIEDCDRVATTTSLLGFEALIRSVPVTCYGRPFYAGWGLTDDRAQQPARRTARPNLAQMAHAVLIDYPRYFDPVTGMPCPPEVVVTRLAMGQVTKSNRANRLLAKLQGLFSGFAPLWRRS